ncbi:hypothetical protein [Mumia sp. Pv 4-285]|uniref:hypothetical protein n=1 Tax=Mumia qirimensis TaxID=3234852 RepID=UPI00351CD25A
MSDVTAGTLNDVVLQLARIARGKPLPKTAVADIGGWARIAADASTLASQGTLPLVAALVARDAEPGDADAATAAAAVADAVLATGQPSLLRDSLDALLTSAAAVGAAGDKLAAGLETVAAAFLARDEREPRADLASADALEVLTQLVAAGHGSQFSLLALLQRFTTPTVRPMARAVMRSVSTAIDIWPAADPLVSVVRIIGGLDPVAAGDPELAADVESDASWVLAMVSLLRALRAASVEDMCPHLGDAAQYFEIAATTHERPDAEPMAAVVKALRELVAGILANDPMGAFATDPLSASEIAGIRDKVHRFTMDSSGLDHWYGDSKRATLTAWTALTNDLEQMGSHLGKDGFYQAEVVIGGLLNVYVSSRSFRVGARGADIAGVQDLVQPVIESGFARNASHLSNLEEFTATLEAQEAPDADDIAKLDAARALVDAARRVARDGDASRKAGGGVPSTPLPPHLGRLVPPGSPDAELLGQMSPKLLEAIEEHMDHVAAGRSHLNLPQQDLLVSLRAKLATSPDYKDAVVPAVDEMLLLIINFVVSRTNSSASHYGYLFDTTANEGAVHEDLYNYLVGNLGDRVHYEVSHIGGGRIDIRLVYDGFALHIEMKVDYTKRPMSDRTAYLKQAATYQGNDIRIGFLVALRHKAFDQTGPPPHIAALIGHTAFDIDGDPEPRHIITVAVPGSRVNPSASR